VTARLKPCPFKTGRRLFGAAEAVAFGRNQIDEALGPEERSIFGRDSARNRGELSGGRESGEKAKAARALRRFLA